MAGRGGRDRVSDLICAGKWGYKAAVRQAQKNIAAILQGFYDDMGHA